MQQRPPLLLILLCLLAWAAGDALDSTEALSCAHRPSFAIGIVSMPGRAALRQAARETWLRSAQYELSFDHRFFISVGPAGQGLTPALQAEADEAGDLVLLRRPEGYAALFRKTAAIFHWGFHVCRAAYTAKMDDDSFLWLGRVARALRPFPVSALYAGLFGVPAPLRTPGARGNPVSRELYPADTYPRCAIGGGYVLSFDLAEIVAEYAGRTHFLEADVGEDVMVAHLLARFHLRTVSLAASMNYNGAPWSCNPEALLHFNCSPERMAAIYASASAGRPQCSGLPA